MRRIASILSCLSVLILSACSSDKTGEERGPCYGNQTCNQGLICLSGLCVKPQEEADTGISVDLGATEADSGMSPVDLGFPDTGLLPDSGEQTLDAQTFDAMTADTGMLVDSGFPDSGMMTPDLGFPDTGIVADMGTTIPDTGVMADAGIVPDAGTGMGCNPLDGSGCATGQNCVWLAPTNATQCFTLGGRVLEQPCNLQVQNCGPGFTCAPVQGSVDGICRRVCSLPGGGLECASLVGASPAYSCAPVNGATYGLCLGQMNLSCNPLTNPCPGGQVCSLLLSSGPQCERAGTVALGGACSRMSMCAPGGTCVDLGSGAECYSACNPTVPTCGAGGTCTQLIGQSFGLCFVPQCQPITNPCPGGQVCSSVVGADRCRTAGAAALGQTCSAMNDCSAGGYCVNIGQGDRCYAPCDVNTPCAAGTCATLTGKTFGICI